MNLFKRYKLLTEDFKSWFGKSILHTNGVPHTFYHGTGSDIEKFSHDHVGKGNDSHGSGFYFTSNPDLASGYASDSKNSPNVIPVHLKIQKPIYREKNTKFSSDHIRRMIVSAPEHKDSLANFGETDNKNYVKTLNSAVNQYTEHSKFHTMNMLHNDFYSGYAGHFLSNLQKITGHDGVIVKEGEHTTVNVFNPNNIKSAISSGYSKKSDSLTEQKDI